jgi:hypothetical protein
MPPIKVEFTPEAKGKVDAIAICFRSDQTQFPRINKTTAEVKESMLSCQNECAKDSECQCNVNNCKSGFFSATIEDKVLASVKFKESPFIGKFTSDTAGTAEVMVSCYDPDKTARAQVKITGPTTTTTTAPSEKKFIGKEFKCTSGKCSLKYENRYGKDVYLIFVFLNTERKVEYSTDAVTILSGSSSTKSTTFDCVGRSGKKFTAMWIAFSDEEMKKPIAWHTSDKIVEIEC